MVVSCHGKCANEETKDLWSFRSQNSSIKILSTELRHVSELEFSVLEKMIQDAGDRTEKE